MDARQEQGNSRELEIISALRLQVQRWQFDPRSAPRDAETLRRAYVEQSAFSNGAANAELLRSLAEPFGLIVQISGTYEYQTRLIKDLVERLSDSLDQLTKTQRRTPSEYTVGPLTARPNFINRKPKPIAVSEQLPTEESYIEEALGLLDEQSSNAQPDSDLQRRKRLAKRREQRTRARKSGLPSDIRLETLGDVRKAIKLLTHIDVHQPANQIQFAEMLFDKLPQPQLVDEYIREPLADLKLSLAKTFSHNSDPLNVRRAGLKDAAKNLDSAIMESGLKTREPIATKTHFQSRSLS